MTNSIMKSGFILYYNIQHKCESDEDHWQKCAIEMTTNNFLMWHTCSDTDVDSDMLQGSIQLGPCYKILTQKNNGIPSDSPSVPKEYKLSQLFGIMMIELNFVYWFIDTTEEQDWIKLFQPEVQKRSSLTDDGFDIINEINSSNNCNTNLLESELLISQNNSSPEKCQYPVTVQPNAIKITSSTNESLNVAPTVVNENSTNTGVFIYVVDAAAEKTCWDMCVHFVCYPLSIFCRCPTPHSSDNCTSHQISKNDSCSCDCDDCCNCCCDGCCDDGGCSGSNCCDCNCDCDCSF